MKKIKLILPFLGILFSKPSLLLKALYHAVVMHNRQKYVERKYDLNHGLPIIDLLDLFPNFEEKVEPFTHLYGTSLPIDMAVLRKFVQLKSEPRYLEIGTWRGESIANVAPFCAECVSVSLSNEEMIELGFSKRMTEMQRFFSKSIKNVTHIEANSKSFDFSQIGRFDVIFVDGDHSYEAVKNDTEKVFPLLKDEHSIIVWHDYTSNYEQIDWEVLSGIMDGTPKELQQYIYHISNTLFAVYIKKNMKTTIPQFPEIPNKKFTIHIKGEFL